MLELNNILQIVQIFSIIGGVTVLLVKHNIKLGVMSHDLKRLEQGLIVLNEAFTQLGKILTQVAVQDNRIIMLEKYIDELRHGQGFVKNKP